MANNNVDILSNPKEAFWKLASPFVLLALFQAGYSIVDMFWVSHIGQQAFFAVGVTAPLVTLLTGLGDAIGTGTNSKISRELGQKDYKGTYNSILHAIVAAIIISFIIILLSFYLKDILRFMNVTASTRLALNYLLPIFLFSFTFIFSSLFVSTLQAEGNSRTPTIVLISTNILNLILDPLLIFVFGWGISGAAYATVISSFIAVSYFLYWYLSGKSRVVLNFKYFKLGIVYEIIVVALPNFLINVVWSIAMIYLNRILVQQLGHMGVLLYSTSIKIESVLISPQKAFGKAMVTISGRLFGANEFEKLKQMYYYALKLSITLVVVCAIIFFFIRTYVYALFSVTGVERSLFYIALVAIFMLPFQEISSMSNRILDGLGKSYHSLILSTCTVLCELVTITLLSPILTSGLCVLVGIAISVVIFGIIYLILVRDMLNGINKMDELIERKKESLQ